MKAADKLKKEHQGIELMLQIPKAVSDTFARGELISSVATRAVCELHPGSTNRTGVRLSLLCQHPLPFKSERPVASRESDAQTESSNIQFFRSKY